MDLGAGTGALTTALVAAGARVVAVERHPDRLAALRARFADDPVTVVDADLRVLRLPRRPFRVVANPPWALAETVRGDLLRSRWLVRADLVLPRWLVHRWSRRSSRIDVGCSLRAESFIPAAPTGLSRGRAPRPAQRASMSGPTGQAVRLRHAAARPAALAARWPRSPLGHHPAAVPGRLYDSGYGWPVAVFTFGSDHVPGTIVDLDAARLSTALAALDEIELAATDVLRRVVVTTTDGETAWTYHCHRPIAGMTRIPRWTSRDER